jgi:hypothetical protein
MIVLGAVLAACGGSSATTTFSDPGASFTFSYPSALGRDFVGAKREVQGRPPSFSTNVGVNPTNVVIVSQYAIRKAAESYDPATLQSSVDLLVRTIARADGATVSGSGKGKLGELPAYTYDVAGPDETTSRILIAFKGKTEYYVKCTWKPAQEAAIKPACDQVASSFAVH